MGPDEIGAFSARLREEIAKVVVGQDAAVDLLTVALLSEGHLLLEGVPGTAKTLLVQSFAAAVDMKFGRIQFTPDLMPGDVIGTNLFNFQSNSFHLTKGPIFTELLLADEINRTPPKTQAALLQAMQERVVTIDGDSYPLGNGFMVIATQNPIEQQGTYPLPEAQLDRFMFFVEVQYPDRDEELRIARETTGTDSKTIEPKVNGEQILKYQELVERVPVPDHIYDLAVDIVRATRPASDDAPDFCEKLVSWGAGPRAIQYLIRGAKARAVLHGNYLVRQEDLEAVAHPVLRHRIITNFQAQAEGTDSTVIVEKLLDQFRDASA